MKVKTNISKRERQVVSLLLLGLKSKDIAKVMGLSEKTIGTYLRRWKEYFNAPLVSNYLALKHIRETIDVLDYDGVLPKYEVLIIKIRGARKIENINNLIQKIQNNDKI